MGKNWNGKCIEAQPSRNHAQCLEYNLIKRLKPNTEASNNSWVLYFKPRQQHSEPHRGRKVTLAWHSASVRSAELQAPPLPTVPPTHSSSMSHLHR